MLRITSVKTRSGTTAVVPFPGILCVVGGNNVGKTQMLRDVLCHLIGNNHRAVILESISYEFSLTPELAEGWFRKNSHIVASPGQPELFQHPRGGSQLTLDALLRAAQSPGAPDFHILLQWFFRALDAGERSTIATASMGMAPGMTTPGSSPLFSMYRDGDLEKELSDFCARTFGFELTLDRVNGDVRLHVGKPGVPTPSLERPTLEYANAVAQLQTLEAQGDGVKNYLGMVAHLMTSPEAVTVIDEPEAFLHPAQARRLGRHIGKVVREKERQLLIATHDRELVLGLLESDSEVTFIRLNRSGNSGSAETLPANKVKEIWSRPELRYSNVLQGIFHRVVVVCEGDADCRWYSAVLDHMLQGHNIASEEALFLPSGGKAGVQNCVEALEAIGVECFAVLDFDAILDPDQLKILLRKFRPTSGDRETIRFAREVRRSVGTDAEYKRAKKGGVSGLASELQPLAIDVIDRLRRRRVLVVGVGELESFDLDIEARGAMWVTRALTNSLHQVCPPAEALLKPVVGALAIGSNNSLNDESTPVSSPLIPVRKQSSGRSSVVRMVLRAFHLKRAR